MLALKAGQNRGNRTCKPCVSVRSYKLAMTWIDVVVAATALLCVLIALYAALMKP